MSKYSPFAPFALSLICLPFHFVGWLPIQSLGFSLCHSLALLTSNLDLCSCRTASCTPKVGPSRSASFLHSAPVMIGCKVGGKSQIISMRDARYPVQGVCQVGVWCVSSLSHGSRISPAHRSTCLAWPCCPNPRFVCRSLCAQLLRLAHRPPSLFGFAAEIRFHHCGSRENASSNRSSNS